MSITDKDLHSASADGDGTYNGLVAIRWMYEALSGKPMSDEEARKLWAEAQAKAKAKRDAR